LLRIKGWIFHHSDFYFSLHTKVMPQVSTYYSGIDDGSLDPGQAYVVMKKNEKGRIFFDGVPSGRRSSVGTTGG
jgi:hypothetical protein